LNPSIEQKRVTVVVGDVVGHGIGAALLMATVRALLRGRAIRAGTLAEIATDVNTLLCKDTSHSGNFVTLFYLEVDRLKQMIRWVRCGHECGLLYYPSKKQFVELRGEGLALGVENEFSYKENIRSLDQEKQLILLGTDGVWDAENPLGERFGKERVKTIIEQFHHLTAETLVEKFSKEIALFQDGTAQDDDITLVIIKIW
jgi:sigma-B regulation protein RsbU (phosphoserine phosphatase)